MAKLKPLKKQSKEVKPDPVKDVKGALPCLLVVIGVMVLIGLLFSTMLKSAK